MNEIDMIYENCYRINPNPDQSFLDQMRVIEIEMRRLKNKLESIERESYRHWDPKTL